MAHLEWSLNHPDRVLQASLVPGTDMLVIVCEGYWERGSPQEEGKSYFSPSGHVCARPKLLIGNLIVQTSLAITQC